MQTKSFKSLPAFEASSHKNTETMHLFLKITLKSGWWSVLWQTRFSRRNVSFQSSFVTERHVAITSFFPDSSDFISNLKPQLFFSDYRK